MRNRFLSLAIFLAALTVAGPVAGEETFFGWGVVRGVGWVDGNLLLQNNEGFELVLLDADATVRDSRGGAMLLKDVPLGAEVEFVGQPWAGVTFAHSLRVSSKSLVSVR